MLSGGISLLLKRVTPSILNIINKIYGDTLFGFALIAFGTIRAPR